MNPVLDMVGWECQETITMETWRSRLENSWCSRRKGSLMGVELQRERLAQMDEMELVHLESEGVGRPTVRRNQ